jgi:sec-independent protein translocase protein TatB
VFDVGIPELFVLALVAMFVFGPDRLPEMAKQAGKMVRTLRQMAAQAKTQLGDELGPEFGDLDLKDLNPRNLVQKHILGDLDAEEVKRPGQQPLRMGEAAPYDEDAT